MTAVVVELEYQQRTVSGGKGKGKAHAMHWRWCVTRPSGKTDTGEWVRQTKKATRTEVLQDGSRHAVEVARELKGATGWRFGGDRDRGVEG